MGDGDVSVHADDDEVEDAGGAGPDVHTEPYEAEIPGLTVLSRTGGWRALTVSPSKDPAVHHLVNGAERKDEDT